MEFRLITFGSPDHQQVRDLREAILRKPLGLLLREEEWKHDAGGTLIGGFRDGRILACCILIPHGGKAQMRQVAVSETVQGQGIGGEMLAFFEQQTRTLGCTEVYAHARCTALNYYLKSGFKPEGEEFLEQGIPHVMVRKQL